MKTAANPRAAGAGAITPHSAPAHSLSPPEALIARREAARRFLASIGAVPHLLNREAFGPVPNIWQVPGWAGTFSDHDLIRLAVEQGLAFEACAREQSHG